MESMVRDMKPGGQLDSRDELWIRWKQMTMLERPVQRSSMVGSGQDLHAHLKDCERLRVQQEMPRCVLAGHVWLSQSLLKGCACGRMH